MEPTLQLGVSAQVITGRNCPKVCQEIPLLELLCAVTIFFATAYSCRAIGCPHPEGNCA